MATLQQTPQFEGCDPQTSVRGLCVDSRRLEPGQAFVALAGATVDSHRFVPNVMAAGAAVAIVQRGSIESVPGPAVWLDDTATALPELAANAFGRPGDHLALAGVTGTNGKTTTAHLVSSMLKQAAHPHARLGTTGNWLVDHEASAGFTTPFPLELQSILADARDRGATDAVMEVSSHALAQGRARPLRFTAVGFTSFSQDHLDFHGTMEAYLQAKCRLARDHLRSDGVAVAAVDGQPAARAFLEIAAQTGASAWAASAGDDCSAEIVAREVELGPDRTRADITTPSGVVRLESPLIGAYNLDNLMVAIGMGLGLGLPLEAIEQALRHAKGAPGRLERVEVPGVCGPRVVVDYAHTPDAVARAIGAVRPLCRGSLVVLLGCGGDRDPTKRPLMGAAAASGADRFWATSDNPRTEDPQAILEQMVAGVSAEHAAKVVREVDRARAIASAIAEATDDDLVLIAGKGHEDYQVLGTAKIHFDDREHARAALEARG